MAKLGTHRLLAPLYQAVTALSQSATKPASAIRRTAVSRAGNGEVRLNGPYTGAADTTVDVQITSGTGTARVTAPQFSGIGTGTLTDLAVTAGTAPQTITVTLLDAGSAAAAARIDLGGVRLVAKEAGADGNDITLAVDQSGLSIARTNYTLTRELPAGTEDTTLAGADLGGPLGTADQVPANALRLRIGQDQGQIYVHWRSFTGGVQSYHFRPALRRAYQAGDAVYAVTGTREVEITDGVTTETLSGITTLADLLAAVVAESDLLAVEGPVDPSRAATNGQGTQDLAIWTSARVEDAGGTGSVYAQRGPERIAVGEAATELIEAVCTAVTATQGAGLGSERWAVRGSVSGSLGLYTSGDQVNGPIGRFRFVIPQRMPEDYDPDDAAPIRAQFTIADTASAAAITADPLRAGRAASNQVVTFTYRARPVAACDPLQVPYSHLRQIERWLGFDFPTPEEALRMGLPAAYQTRLQALYTWRAAFADANCRHEIWNADTRYRMFRVAELDLDLCDAVTRILAGCLQQIHTSEDGVDDWDDAFDAAQEDLAPFGTSAIEQLYPRAELWDDNKAYTPGQFIKSAQVPGWVFVCIQGGRSGSSEPSDAQGAETPARADSTQYAVGDRVLPATENGWIYQCTNAGTSGAAEPEATAGIAATYWAASTAYSLGDYIVPNSKNGGRYKCTQAGTTAATYPTFGTTDGGVTTSGGAQFTRERYWQASTAYAEGAICEPGDGRKYLAVTGGISGTAEPVFSPTAGAITDGTVVWHVLNALPTTENATCADGTLLWSAVSRYWAASTAVAAGTVAEPGNGYRYLCTVAGVTDTDMPTWPTTPGTVTDGTVTWTLLGGWEDTLGDQTYDGSVIWEAYEQYWEAEAAYTEDDTMLPWTGQKYICMSTGDSGTVEPIWTAGYAAFADGDASWQRQSAVTSGAAEAIQPDRVEYVSNVWQWNGVTESTVTTITPGQPGRLATFGGQAGSPPTPEKVEKITTLDKTTYVYARVWRINDGLVQPIYSRSWFTSTMSGTEVTNLLEVAQEEMEVFLQEVRNEMAGMSRVEDYVRKWSARADQTLAIGGVEPNFSAATASSKEAGSELWRDPGDAYWWMPEGTDYLPAFNNVEYVSCRRNADGTIVSTQEFAFAIRVGTCAVLADGDTLAIHLGDARWGNTYQVGDTLTLVTVAGAPVACTGGADADAVQTWAVSGSVDGALDPYSCDPAAPSLYSDGGVAFKLHQGGIPYTAGDLWQFAIEAGTYKYRVGVGAWSADTDIGPKSLSSGLALAFTDGVSPSFVGGDTAAFSVAQPYAADHALTPTDEVLAWTGTGTVITATCTGGVDAILIARHTLPSTAVVRVQDGALLDQTMTWCAGPMVLLLASALTSPTLTITITVATGGTIGWLWAGAAHQTDLPAETQTRRVRHVMQRGSGANPAALRLGSGAGYAVEFSGWLKQAEVTALEAMIGAAKASGDLPVVWVPVGELPGEAALVRLPDELDISDLWDYWRPETDSRRLRLTLELDPWLTP